MYQDSTETKRIMWMQVTDFSKE